ncbi:hypothetical protein [Coleofasciculus sp. H7-2]
MGKLTSAGSILGDVYRPPFNRICQMRSHSHTAPTYLLSQPPVR